MIGAIEDFLWAMKYGHWYFGFENYPGKPMLAFHRVQYDGMWINALHIGAFWVECGY